MFLQTLFLLFKGMAAIFVVMGIIFGLTYLLNKYTNIKKE